MIVLKVGQGLIHKGVCAGAIVAPWRRAARRNVLWLGGPAACANPLLGAFGVGKGLCDGNQFEVASCKVTVAWEFRVANWASQRLIPAEVHTR